MNSPTLTTTRSRNGTLDAQIAGADIEPVAAPILLDFKSPTTATHGPNQPEGTPIGALSAGWWLPDNQSPAESGLSARTASSPSRASGRAADPTRRAAITRF